MDYIDNYTMDNFTSSPFPSPPMNKALYIGFLLAVLIIGMIANTSLIWLVATVRELRTPPSVLLTNQSIGDLCFLGFSMIPQLVGALVPGYNQQPWLCHLNHFTYFTSFAVSALSLMAISIERYCAIVIPLKFRMVRSLRTTSAVCGFIWLLASTFGAYAVSATESASARCTYPYEQLSFRIYFMFQLIFLYVVPVLCMSVFYGICARHLLRKEIRTSGTDNARVRVAINLMVITLVFSLCWLPHYIYYSWFLFFFDLNVFGTKSMYLFRASRAGLYYFASCINPIILYAMSSSFRRHFIRKVTCFVAHREGQESSQLSGRTYTALSQQHVSNVMNTHRNNVMGHKEARESCDVQMDKMDKYGGDKEEEQVLRCPRCIMEDGV